MNEYIVRKTYLSFVVVSVLTSITATIGMLIDNIIVGQAFGQDALGAMGIVGPLSLVFSAVGNICSGGGGARAARALGSGDRYKVNMIFTINLIFILVIGGALTVFGLLFTPQIAGLLGAKGVLVNLSRQYMYGYFLGAIPTILLSGVMSFIRIDGSPRFPLICIVVMSVSNIVLDLMMVYVFHKGMFGMALATTISYCLAVGVAFLHFLKKDAKLKLVKPQHFVGELSRTIITGLPTAISQISDTIKVMLLNNVMVTFVSVAAVTALNVRTQAHNFLGAIVIGIGQAITPTMGMFFGEEDKSAMKGTLKTALRFGLSLVTMLALVVVAFPDYFAGLLGVEDGQVMDMSKKALVFFAIGMPIYLINSVLISFYQCTKRVVLATLICVMQSLVYTVCLAAVLVHPLDDLGVWLAFLLGEILTLATVTVYVCVKNKKISVGVDSFMMMDKDFGGLKKDIFEISIGNSMDEVVSLSSGIDGFYQERNITDKALNTLCLSIEEMAGNIVKHAFRQGEKRWIDLKILDKPDAVIIRLRDNGEAFDPIEHLKKNNPNEYGIRLIHGLAKNFEYRRSMGLNNLFIEIEKENI